jgi:hypothetical protein
MLACTCNSQQLISMSWKYSHSTSASISMVIELLRGNIRMTRSAPIPLCQRKRGIRKHVPQWYSTFFEMIPASFEWFQLQCTAESGIVSVRSRMISIVASKATNELIRTMPSLDLRTLRKSPSKAYRVPINLFMSIVLYVVFVSDIYGVSDAPRPKQDPIQG